MGIIIFYCVLHKNLYLKKNIMLMKVYLLFQTHLNLSILMIIGLNLSINTCIMVRQYSVLLTNCSNKFYVIYSYIYFKLNLFLESYKDSSQMWYNEPFVCCFLIRHIVYPDAPYC